MKSENEIIRECKYTLDILRAHRLLEYKQIHVVYGKSPSDRIKGQQMAGMPDMQLYLKGGVTLNIEFKSSTGKQRQGQKEWEAYLTELGHFYYVVNSQAVMIGVLAQHGIDVTRYTWRNCPVST